MPGFSYKRLDSRSTHPALVTRAAESMEFRVTPTPTPTPTPDGSVKIHTMILKFIMEMLFLA